MPPKLSQTETQVAPKNVERTPENTPLPGGGQWAWDEAKRAWVSREPQSDQPPQSIQE